MSAKTQNEAFWRAENRWREKWEAEEPITEPEKQYGQYLRTCERIQGFATGWFAWTGLLGHFYFNQTTTKNMAYQYRNTDDGKKLFKVRYGFAAKNEIMEKIKDKAGRIYARMRDGSLRKLEQLKPWNSKKERKQVLRQRREDRHVLA